MSEDTGAPVEQIVGEYRSNFALYKSCTDRLRDLLEQLLGAAGLSDRIHSVTCRPKGVEKLREKLSREERHYTELSDVTDLVGLRVITYFADDVDKIATLIQSQFDVDPANALYKRKALAPDRFG
ncbi:MAG: RelA/SpoT domain-containing protein, partial [Chloroflexi bacterium]|nr:RelA/SpoT domain-containing protein [Chloroflexota bacterium]